MIRLERKGTVHYETSGKRTKREALLREAELRLQIWPELEAGPSAEIPTLTDFTRMLFPFWTRELKPRTRQYYTVAFNALLEFEPLASARLSDIGPSLVERFKTHRAKTVGTVTINHSIRALRRALHVAVDKFEYKFKVPRFTLQAEPKRDFVVSEADFQRFLEHIGKQSEGKTYVEPDGPAVTLRGEVLSDGKGRTVALPVRKDSGRQTLQALITVLYDRGLRASEACSLTWDRVNLEKRWLTIDTGKTKAARRRVPLTSRVVTVLTALKETAKDVSYVFVRHGHNPITPGWASHEFLRVRKLLGLPDGCVLHSLRHSAASRLGNAGVTTADLMAIMGWESPHIAKVYTHLSEERLQAVMSLLEPSQPEARQ